MTNRRALEILVEPDRIGCHIIKANDPETCEYNADSQTALNMAIKALAQQRTGHWIRTTGENGVTSSARCSECGFEDNRYELFNFCPKCGAKMIEPQEREERK